MHLVPQATFPSAKTASSCRTKLCQVPRLGRGGRKNTWAWFIKCKTTTRCCCVIPGVELRLVLRKWNKTGWVNLMCPKLGVSSEIQRCSVETDCSRSPPCCSAAWLQPITRMMECAQTFDASWWITKLSTSFWHFQAKKLIPINNLQIYLHIQYCKLYRYELKKF